jgi:hypothetical protein
MTGCFASALWLPPQKWAAEKSGPRGATLLRAFKGSAQRLRCSDFSLPLGACLQLKHFANYKGAFFLMFAQWYKFLRRRQSLVIRTSLVDSSAIDHTPISS